MLHLVCFDLPILLLIKVMHPSSLGNGNTPEHYGGPPPPSLASICCIGAAKPLLDRFLIQGFLSRSRVQTYIYGNGYVASSQF